MRQILDNLQMQDNDDLLLEGKPISYWKQNLKRFKLMYMVFVGTSLVSFIVFVGAVATMYFSEINSINSTQVDADTVMLSILGVLFIIIILIGILGFVLNIWQVVLGVNSYLSYKGNSIYKKYLLWVIGGAFASFLLTPIIVIFILPIIFYSEINSAINTKLNN